MQDPSLFSFCLMISMTLIAAIMVTFLVFQHKIQKQLYSQERVPEQLYNCRAPR